MDKIDIQIKHISRLVLSNHHHNIVQDIQGDVIFDLYEKQVLIEQEYKEIISKNNREKVACELLELLPSKGIHGLHQFLNYLSIYYSWIAIPLCSSIIKEYNEHFQITIKNILTTTGAVPQLSSRHVSRAEHVTTLKEHLTKLAPGYFIVVNGMTGCGKTSLVVEVLNDPLITMYYLKGYVQWIQVGRDDSNVGVIQTEILNRINDHEQLISTPLNTDYKSTRRTLQNLWKKNKLTDGLLILDDVCNSEIVKYLDIGCKILITTHDKRIMDDIVDTRVQFIKVNEGFKEKESLELFSKCLNVNYKFLPPHASKLHNICKGFPLTISLIGAQLEAHREETINNTDRWTFYLKELSDKTTEPFKFTPHSHKKIKSLQKTIEMCIQNLPDDLQKKYHDFSLFVHDVNIKPEVLSVLWKLEKIQVEDIMLELRQKNLVVRVWNQPLNSYVYSIHDLLLTYLKQIMSPQESKKLHKKLIESYRTNCSGNFAELPKDDNYIFLYFGYHLKKADMLEEFPLWFLNLKFLESKICVTGPADLLTDLRKYRKYIAVKSEYEEYVKEIENFVKIIGPNLYLTKCDIVQLGLYESDSSFVYKESYKIAKSSGKPYFYYNIPKSQNCLPKPHISIVRDKIIFVIFGNKYDEVLIATKNGSIKVWNIMTQKCLYTYKGHTQKVTYLVKNKLKDTFLSTSDDSTIRIWKMKSFPESDDSETRTPSPETRQEHWKNLFDTNYYERPTDISDCLFTLKDHSGPVIFAQFSADSEYIVSASTDKTLKIWKLNNGTEGSVVRTIKQINIVNCCYFMESMTTQYILFSNHSISGSGIYVSEWPYDHTTGLKYLEEKLISFFPLRSTDDNKLMIVTPKNINILQYSQNKVEVHRYPQLINNQTYKFFSISEECTKDINNSQYLAFSLSNCTIQISDALTGYKYLNLNDPVEGILNLDWYYSKTDQSNWLLCAAEDQSIRLWCLNDITQHTCAHQTITTQSNCKFKNICKNEVIILNNYKLFSEKQNLFCYTFKQNFDAVWLDNNSLLIAAITQCGKLKVLLKGLDQWSMIDNSVSTLSIIHLDNKSGQTIIIVACEDLSVHLLKSQTSQYLFNTGFEVDRIFTYNDYDYLIIAVLLKKNDLPYNVIEIWANGKKLKDIHVIDFINCFIFHDKIILLFNIYEIMIINIYPEITIEKTEIQCIRSIGNVMLNNSTLVVTDTGDDLRIFELNTNNKLNQIELYKLPFIGSKLLSISISNNKQFIAVGGQKDCIVIIDIILKTVKQTTIDSSVNNIQSIIWSSDDSRLAIKEANRIIAFDVEFNRKIASVKLTSDKFSVDSDLSTFITINTAGKLVLLNLSSSHN